MKPSNRDSAPHAGLVAPYQSIPDYDSALELPATISVLYARLSSDDKQKGAEDDSDSIVNQKLILAKFAQDNRMQNPIFFVDDGLTGVFFDNRPDLQAALALADAGRVANFVCKDLSRFGRDRHKVDFYHEVLFPDLGVRFVAIGDNIDTSKGENDIAPFISLFNEWYPRNVSRKVREVKRAKGMAGERISSFAPYGYQKDPENSKKLIVDEPAAEVVRKIFRLCLAGLGVTHIANQLRAEQILTPTSYSKRDQNAPVLPDNPYDWGSATIGQILERREYLGHTVNFKTTRKSFKSKKTILNPPEEQAVFENTHEAIIDQETFDRVQELRKHKRRRAKSGRLPLFSGLVWGLTRTGSYDIL